MTRSKRLSWVNVSVATLGIVGFSLAASASSGQAARAVDEPAATTEWMGYTAPSEKRVQNFDLPGVIQDMKVKEGAVVKSGQLLAQQNLAPDLAHLRSLEILANSKNLETAADEAEQRLDEVDLKRKTELFKTHAISPSDFDQAQLKVEVDGLKVKNAKSEEDHARADVEEEKARIEQKKLYARIDGVVSEISVREGEVATSNNNDPLKPGVITIVNNDPLYVEVDLPSDLVKQLKTDWKNKSLQVQYVDDKTTWHDAKIHFIKPEADPRSNTEHVQLEMPNPDGRSSGLQVSVRMPAGGPAPSGAAAAANVGH
jgi:RND family efflux transporter MFP subunit